MHPNSMAMMEAELERVSAHLNRQGKSIEALTVLDVGALDVNGTYRPMCERRGLEYYGLDSQGGPNVDLCVSIYDFVPIHSYDLVICGQTLEHMERPDDAVQVMKDLVRAGGWLILIAPNLEHEHRHPIDCWRIFPDAMRYMLRGFDEIHAERNRFDTLGRGRKPCMT